MSIVIEKNDLIQDLVLELKEIKPELKEDIEAEQHFSYDLGLDSLDITEFIARSEQKYQIEIDDDDWRELVDLNKLTDYIIKQLHD